MIHLSFQPVVKFTKDLLQRLEVMMWYYEGDTTLKLEWTNPSTHRVVIPSFRLYSFVDVLYLRLLRILVHFSV